MVLTRGFKFVPYQPEKLFNVGTGTKKSPSKEQCCGAGAGTFWSEPEPDLHLR